MATYPFNALADWDPPGGNVTTTDADWATIVGIYPFYGRVASSLSPVTGGELLSRGVVLVEDYNVSDSGIRGRHWHYWNQSNNAFLTSGRRLLGEENVDAPDLVGMDDAVFGCDGAGRWGAGTTPFDYVFADDGSSFTDETTDAQDPGAGDVNLTPAADLQADDAIYFGAASTFSGISFIVSQVLVATSSTFVIEYSQGSSNWAALSTTWNPEDVLSEDFATLGSYIGSWTPPGDWATDTVNSQGSQYWIRIRASAATAGGSYQGVQLTNAFLIETTNGITAGRLPAAMYVSSSPGNSTTVMRGWGLHRLEDNATAQVSAALASSGTIPAGTINVYYSFWDSTREIGTDLVSLGSLSPSGSQKLTVTVGAHPDPNVSHVRIFFEGISGNIAVEAEQIGDTVQISTGEIRLMAQFAIASGANDIEELASDGLDGGAWEEIDPTRYGDGPYLASSIPTDELDGRPGTTLGNYLSCCQHLNFVVCAGSYVAGYERRVAWSHPGNPWCFSTGRHTGRHWVDLPGDGDRIVAVRSIGRTIVVFMRRATWLGLWNSGSGVFDFQQVSNMGATARRGCVVAGQKCFFLSRDGIFAVDANGAMQDVGGDVVDVVRGLKESLEPAAVGAYDPSRQLVLWSLSGLQSQLGGAAAPFTTTMNDGVLVLNLRDGTYRVWHGTGCFATSMAFLQTGDVQGRIATGNPWGRVHWFDYSGTQDAQAATNGATTSGTATTLRPSSGTCLDASSDRRQLGEWLIKYNTTNGFEARLITNSDGTDFTVGTSWTNNPVSGDLWWIGAYYQVVEFGDWHFGQPGHRHTVNTVQLHLEAAMNSANAMDLATDNVDVAQSGTYGYSNGTVSTTETQEILAANKDAGYVQRIRLAALLNGARPVLRGLTVDVTDHGSPK